MTNLNNQVFLCSLLAIVLSMVSSCKKCNSKKASETEVLDTLRIDGSSTVFPMTAEIVDQYNRQFGDLKITTSVSGTGGGFSKFTSGEIEINNASREIKKEEHENCESADLKYSKFKIAIDGIAVVVNKENNWAENLTVSELKSIWSNENIRLWSDVRSSWPSSPIELYSPGEASGTYDYFKEAILADSTFRSDIKRSENDNLLALGVGNSPNAIGFFALAYFEENKDKLKLLAVDNGNGPVTPGTATVSAGQYTPLSRPLFIYVNDAFLEKETGKKFIRFYLNKSATAAQKVGYIPLASKAYAEGSAAL